MELTESSNAKYDNNQKCRKKHPKKPQKKNENKHQHQQ
jgi:hypothetical protein